MLGRPLVSSDSDVSATMFAITSSRTGHPIHFVL